MWKLASPSSHEGKVYTLPLPPEQGTGLGKPLKMITHPVREVDPDLSVLGPKNVELTAELADGWPPIFFPPGEGDACGATIRCGPLRQ